MLLACAAAAAAAAAAISSCSVAAGELHNNIRMTWGKAILPWSPDPDTAIKRTVYLNHKYALDGCDPCSYSGILWCYGVFVAFAPARLMAITRCGFCICKTVVAACVVFADASAMVIAAAAVVSVVAAVAVVVVVVVVVVFVTVAVAVAYYTIALVCSKVEERCNLDQILHVLLIYDLPMTPLLSSSCM